MKKKLLAMLLAVTMMMGMSLTSFAANETIGDSDDTGSITVYGIEEKDATVYAYKIVKANYNKNDKTNTDIFAGYEALVPIADLKKPTLAELEAITKEQLETLENYELTYDTTSNTYVNPEVPVGMYLVKIDQEEVTEYSYAVVSVYYSNDDQTGNEIENGELTMTTKIKDGVAWVKKSIEVDVTKTVNDKQGITSDIGDINNYVVAIDPVPNYSGEYPVLKVTDVMSAGLAYQDDVKVYIVEENGTETELAADKYKAEFDEDTNTLTVNFVLETTADNETVYTYTLNEHAGKIAEIRYTAEVDMDAALNGGENNNVVTLDYTVDSTVEGDDKTDNDEAHVYTFDINGQIEGNLTEKILTKVIESTSTTTDKTPLADAEFKLYTDADCTKQYKNDIHTEGLTTTSDAKGKFAMTGLEEGTYYFKETKAPAGYSLNTHVYVIEIDATLDYEVDDAVDPVGKLVSWDVTIDGETTSTFEMTSEGAKEVVEGTVDIPNTKLIALPSTGGIGTTIFTVAGCGIMIAAAGFFFMTRKKEEE